MKGPRLRTPSPALVISCIALFVALGGSSYAVVALPKNSVGARQIKKDAVRASEVAANAVRGAEVKDGTLGGVDVLDGSLGGSDVADGSLGGVDVLDGSLGGSDVAPGTFLGGKVTVQTEEAVADLADGAKASYNAFCPEGQIAVGGGARGDATDSEHTVVGSSRPAKSPTNTEPPSDGETFSGWRVTVHNPTGGVTTGIRPRVWVICAAL